MKKDEVTSQFDVAQTYSQVRNPGWTDFPFAC